MYIYLSPILGERSEEFYDTFMTIRSKSYSDFIKDMRNILNYKLLRTGVLVVETTFNDIEVSGNDIYDYLIKFGFSDTISVNITRLFSTNNRLIERLVDEGYSVNDVVYGMDLKDRLKHLGLVSANTNKSYALKDIFTVHKLLQVHIPEEELVVEPVIEKEILQEIWRPFQISVLIDCTTSDKRGARIRRSVEFRGVFVAEKNSIIDWSSYTKRLAKANVYSLLGDAGTVAEVIMQEYASHKGYQDLIECAVPIFDGINILEDLPDIIVSLDESGKYITENLLDVNDLDKYKSGKNWGNFSDKVKYIGHWWENKSYAITEMRKQIQSESRW